MSSITPAFSRRAAPVVAAPLFQADPKLRQDFIAALDVASTFEDLPQRWQMLFLQAERQIQSPRAEDYLDGLTAVNTVAPTNNPPKTIMRARPVMLTEEERYLRDYLIKHQKGET